MRGFAGKGDSVEKRGYFFLPWVLSGILVSWVLLVGDGGFVRLVVVLGQR